MNYNTTTAKFVLAILFTSLLFGRAAWSADTEIYTGGSTLPSAAKPNIVFIIDTSGSMSGDVEVTDGTFDPAITYAGDCTIDRHYWDKSGRAPNCSTSQYFAVTSNKCSDSTSALSNTGSGFYVVRAARYRTSPNGSYWDILNPSDHDDNVECVPDFGVHGETSAGQKYPADASEGGPWRSNTTGAINWNNTGETYTFYNGNYLNWLNGDQDPVTKTRLQIVKDVFADVVDSVSNVNIAVMRFDDKSRSANKGGYFVMPMQEITSANRADYKTAVNAFTPNGYTPLAETLYESYLFYKGDAVLFGDDTSPATNHVDVFTGANYDTPIAYQCQKNFTILLTDGEPTFDTDADSAIQGLPGFSAATGSSRCSGNCLDELADYMYTKDCSNLDDKQNVITYTIGFHTDQTLLQNAATKGGGQYYTADNTSGLNDAFTSILTEILSINTTFIAPAVSVNAFNRFTHREELYYALFRPAGRPNWDGNIKRFKLAGNPPIIVDQNNVAAIDPNTGFFKPSITSFWTVTGDAPDGDEVELGGAASRLALPRNIYTYTGTTAANNEDLTVAANKVHEDTVAIDATMLGDVNMSATRRTTLLQWARGVDLLDKDADTASTDIRRYMGDPLHAKPALITYGGTNENPDITLYSGTNEGHLHAINTTNGSELFSFIPKELLTNIAILYDNSSGVAHPYGLDGPLSTWVNDVNGNGVILAAGVLETNEHAYLYQGMRRGGKNYYALDVSNRASPKLKWMITGGTGDFSELAQSWSAMSKAKIKLNGVDTTVLIFGGGYDVDQDNNSNAAVDTEGRAVFMVNASTGAKIWQAGPAGSANGSDPNLVLSGMTNSIPADVRVIDTDFDGYKDRMYVGDMGGRVWRFDINNDDNTGAANLVTGGVIANISGSGPGNNRRFYYTPDVSLSKDKTYINIAIGSGYRAHPLNSIVEDAFFVFRDEAVYAPAVDDNGAPLYTPIILNQLYDATSNVIGQGTTSQITTAQTELAGKKGLLVWLKSSAGSFIGEKVLAKSITFSGTVMFTTYTPVANVNGACSPSQGAARIYMMNIADGTPVDDNDHSGGVLTIVDRKIDLVRGGIPPEPSIIFHKNGPVVFVGTEKIGNAGLALTPRKTKWYIE